MKDAPAFHRISAISAMPTLRALRALRRAAAPGGAPAAALVLSACAHNHAARFDVDAFLRGSDTALPEVLGNTDFLKATRLAQNECATLLQSPHNGVLEDLPASNTTRGPAWILHPKATPDKVWLIVGQPNGDRSCHGPLPADAMQTLTDRAKG
ncbi:Lipoprotein [Cupriavidus sp. H18C2]